MPQDPQQVVEEALKSGRVIMFSKSICPKCKKAKAVSCWGPFHHKTHMAAWDWFSP